MQPTLVLRCDLSVTEGLGFRAWILSSLEQLLVLGMLQQCLHQSPEAVGAASEHSSCQTCLRALKLSEQHQNIEGVRAASEH